MSTKTTLLHGENYHLYREAFEHLPRLIMNGKEIELPEDFAKALLTLIRLHESCKYMIEYTKELDKVDGGLFSFSLDTGEKSEFKDGEFKKGE